MSNPVIGFVVFCTGLCIGSFLNVCISRLPLGQSLVHPGSRCPQCGTPIRFYDNIPVISYLLLGAKCRACRKTISLRYPAIELLTGAVACAIVLKHGITLSALIYFVFTAALIVVTFIDLDHRIIPDRISLTGIVAGLGAAFFLPEMTWTDSLIGIAAGGGSLFAVALGYYLLTGKEGMGGGDIKLLAMIGAFTGWQGILFTIFVASATGTAVGLLFMAAKGKNLKFAVPFGPFLSVGAFVYILFGPAIIHWYLMGFRPY